MSPDYTLYCPAQSDLKEANFKYTYMFLRKQTMITQQLLDTQGIHNSPKEIHLDDLLGNSP